ncbi:MAG TPA: DNA repair protein RadA [Polyangiaceae bacterium]|nr:DNA repair protein RadA [Polyangiaceae bacterium]
MAKLQTKHVCQACGASFTKWIGRCTECGAWNTVSEEVVRDKPRGAAPASRAVPLSEVAADEFARVPTGIGELDRILGGGVVLGGVTLVGGDPGIGKSTLLLQALAGLASRKLKCLYVSGEESAGQTAARARRLGAHNDELMLLADTQLESVEAAIEEHKPRAVVVDSVQTIRCAGLDSAAGTVSQLREVTSRIIDVAKKNGIAVLLVGHVTKDGVLAGPKVLEHLVDTVLAFEGERTHALRTLRAQKNRFGSATEVGVFEMRAEGLREVPNPSALFLAERPRGAPGSVIAATCEGARALLVEVQALVGSMLLPSPRRTTNGVDGSRVAMLVTVLERRAGLQMGGYDIFVNVAGGVRVDEPAIDLPVAIALASSFRGKPIRDDVVAFGEIGLAGEVRNASRARARLAEAAAMGFKRAILPPMHAAGDHVEIPEGIEVKMVRTLAEALETAL